MDPGLCCAFVTPQTRRHTGQSIPGHQTGYGFVMSKNASTTTPVNKYLDSNLNRRLLCVLLVAHASSRIADQHGRWARTVW